ncbi:MAG: hypothetical protein EHM33_09800 [Chloroflexi bacterium]|nr:MAG: hypothetical protein EHM33_09800 [Chloroflexota bacterium]
MTQRSILVGTNQTIIIKGGGSVTVKGHEGDRLSAETAGTGGLTVERRSEAEIGRARAAVGEHVIFDVRIKLPNLKEKVSDDVIEVQISGSGEVRVPFGSNLKVYAGKDIEVQGIRGQVDAFAGLNLDLQDVHRLGNVSAGGTMNIDCQKMIGKDVTFGAGRDLRFHVADLTSARLRVKDIGGYWEARIGEGEKSVTLKSGGDVTFVTDQKVEPLPPNYILGKIEKPTGA